MVPSTSSAFTMSGRTLSTCHQGLWPEASRFELLMAGRTGTSAFVWIYGSSRPACVFTRCLPTPG